MTAPRAAWKGFLKVGAVSCAVKLIGATSESDRIRFRILNRKTQQPVRSAYLDEETGKPVETDDQVKGYELGKGRYLLIDPEEISALKLKSEHTLEIDGFVPVADIDQRYLDKPYYVVPADKVALESFVLLRDAMAERQVAARSCVVLYQRGREVVLVPHGAGMVMTTLRPAGEMLSEKQAFHGLKETKPDAEMVEFAGLLIDKKRGRFDPSAFEDTYENALIAMIRAKQQGKKPPKSTPPPKENVVNLAALLKKSLENEGGAKTGPSRKKGKAA